MYTTYASLDCGSQECGPVSGFVLAPAFMGAPLTSLALTMGSEGVSCSLAVAFDTLGQLPWYGEGCSLAPLRQWDGRKAVS